MFLFQYSFFLFFFSLYIVTLASLLIYTNATKLELKGSSQDTTYTSMRAAVSILNLLQLASMVFVVSLNKSNTSKMSRLFKLSKGSRQKVKQLSGSLNERLDNDESLSSFGTDTDISEYDEESKKMKTALIADHSVEKKTALTRVPAMTGAVLGKNEKLVSAEMPDEEFKKRYDETVL